MSEVSIEKLAEVAEEKLQEVQFAKEEVEVAKEVVVEIKEVVEIAKQEFETRVKDSKRKAIEDNIEKAKIDENIKAIYLNTSFVNAGISQTEEIRNKLLEFKIMKSNITKSKYDTFMKD